MASELPYQRLHRRLGGADVRDHPAAIGTDSTEADLADPDADGDPSTLLPRWLPDHTSTGAGWLQAIRGDPGRAGAIALAVVAVLAVLVTIFTLIRDKPPPVASAKLPAVEMVSSASPRPGVSAPAAGDGPLVVSVVGLVHKPGLVTLTQGARIADALTAAGGVIDGADTVGLNMARHLTDGEQIVVGIASPPGEPAVLGSSITPGTSPGSPPAAAAGKAGLPPDGAAVAQGAGVPIDLNSATVEQLDTLPGVGPVTAAAIVAWRGAHGRFTSIDQLGEVDGIGPGRLEKLRSRVRV